jgi:hypothetical protein
MVVNEPRRWLRMSISVTALSLAALGAATAGDDTSITGRRSGSGSSSRGHGGLAVGAAASGVGLRGNWIPYYAIGWPSGMITYYSPPYVVYTPAGPVVTPNPLLPPVPVSIQRGPLVPAPPAALLGAPPERLPAARPVPRRDATRAAQLILLGDRLFRAMNVKRAEERYQQAEKLDPSSATVQLRMAQVAIVRERYAEAAHRLRDAETAQPGWIVNSPDVQSLYGEPQEFARHLKRLESHLQAHPEDHDAWLVLGAQWYLSGRTARAADVFARIHDPRRKPDIALAAFLEATNQH